MENSGSSPNLSLQHSAFMSSLHRARSGASNGRRGPSFLQNDRYSHGSDEEDDEPTTQITVKEFTPKAILKPSGQASTLELDDETKVESHSSESGSSTNENSSSNTNTNSNPNSSSNSTTASNSADPAQADQVLDDYGLTGANPLDSVASDREAAAEVADRIDDDYRNALAMSPILENPDSHGMTLISRTLTNSSEPSQPQTSSTGDSHTHRWGY